VRSGTLTMCSPTGLKIYPVASFVNMTIVPLDMRTSFSELVGFFWNWYLSMAFAATASDEELEDDEDRDEEDDDDDEENEFDKEEDVRDPSAAPHQAHRIC